MNADQIINGCTAIAERMFPENSLLRANYLNELLSTKLREILARAPALEVRQMSDEADSKTLPILKVIDGGKG